MAGTLLLSAILKKLSIYTKSVTDGMDWAALLKTRRPLVFVRSTVYLFD